MRNPRILLIILFPVFRIVLPRILDMVAPYVADYLNERREHRKVVQAATIELEAKLEADRDLQTLCTEAFPELATATKLSLLPLAGSALIGVVIGVISGIAVAKQEALAAYLNRFGYSRR